MAGEVRVVSTRAITIPRASAAAMPGRARTSATSAASASPARTIEASDGVPPR